MIEVEKKLCEAYKTGRNIPSCENDMSYFIHRHVTSQNKEGTLIGRKRLMSRFPSIEEKRVYDFEIAEINSVTDVEMRGNVIIAEEETREMMDNFNSAMGKLSYMMEYIKFL